MRAYLTVWPVKSSTVKSKTLKLQKKKTYAEIASKFIDDLAKDEANELQAIKE
jgi:hypothetical protein